MTERPMRRLPAWTRMTDLDGKREFSFPDIRGWTVLNTTGHEVGKVEEVFVDPNSLEPMMALLHYQKFMNRNTKMLLVPWSEVQIVGSRQVRTRPTEEQFADAPDWDESLEDWEPVTEYWTRRATAAGGDTDAPVEANAGTRA